MFTRLPWVMLWQLEPSGLITRGGKINLHGSECVYIGCTPEGNAYFWVESNDVRYLTNTQLLELGFELREYKERK